MNKIVGILVLLALFMNEANCQTPPMTRLTDVFCYNYNLPTLYSNFVAFKQTCGGYIFDVENQTTMQSASFTTYGSVAGRSTNLSNFPGAGIQYSTTYKVRVRTWIGTPANTSAYHPTLCYVVTPAAVSKVQASQCNTTLTSLFSPIYADNIVGAEAFEYQLTKLPSGTIDTYQKTSGTINAFSLGDFSNSFIDYNTTYEVRVRVKVNGIFGPFGTMCTITTPTTIPSSQLSIYCNSTLPFLNSPIIAVQIPGADAYKFQVTNGVNTTEIIPNPIDYTTVLVPSVNTTYAGTPADISWVGYNMPVQIRVAVNIDGAWQPYGPICTVTTPCGTQLTQAMNGKIVNYLHYDDILADLSTCTVLEDYQFRYRIGSNSTTYVTASAGNEATASGTDNKVFIADFGPITNFPSSNPYGKDYRISVRLKVNGAWTDWGIERIVKSVTSPVTKIRDGVFPVAGTSQCGSSFASPFQMSSISTILGSYNLYGFANSTFEVTELDGLGNNVITKTLTRDVATYGSMARAFRLNMIEASTPTGTDGYWATKFNTVFKIRVKTNLGNYSDVCYVKTPIAIMIDNEPYEITDEMFKDELATNTANLDNSNEIDETNEQVTFFPNPYSKSLSVKYTEAFSKLNFVSIRDVSGKEIYVGNITFDDFVNLELLENLNQGIYYVEIVSGSKDRQVTRLIKGLN
ncbi:MAG: T9SS type A sorting domain-containing protein [Crocinitomicaceae bacterium]|nr:T9SS type A sorting domain-containing protein [Crocinitomicaceae bacterium]MCF8443596.1 T9SS type A sorting domain-containing protein [Crocinitomicaceae bacterium]